jgi:hypothetical protein
MDIREFIEESIEFYSNRDRSVYEIGYLTAMCDCKEFLDSPRISETPKKVLTNEMAWKIQKTYDGPHGWIQWKGTDVCMDIQCKCGYMSHVDAEFAYNVKCPECGTVYMCNGHIELIEIEQEPDDCVVEGE